MCDQLQKIVYKSALLSNTAAGCKRFILKKLISSEDFSCILLGCQPSLHP